MIPLYVCILSIGLTVSICLNLFLLYENGLTSEELDETQQELYEVSDLNQKIVDALNREGIEIQEQKTDLM